MRTSKNNQRHPLLDVNKLPKIRISKLPSKIELVSADRFTFAQLTEAYNHTRVDYLVPMPMNERKLREYAFNYDVDLAQSAVVADGSEILGLAMLGVRGDKTWITRLGVVPNGRKKGIGSMLMEQLIDNSRKLGAKEVILEVIKNNTPAENLFNKCGFETFRELLVTRRPPKPINVVTLGTYVEPLGYQEALEFIKRRVDEPSWVTSNESMQNAGNLSALHANLPDGGEGWLVYQNTVFQLARLVLKVETGDTDKVTKALLENLHWRHSVQDTICENLPVDSEYWPAMQEMGYIVSFGRIELHMSL